MKSHTCIANAGKARRRTEWLDGLANQPRCACGKVSHPTRAQAAKALRRMPKNVGGRLNVYQCNRVGSPWHVGHA
jgi:hypothetical protein